MKPFTFDGQEVKKTDIIRRKELEGNFGGAIVSLNYRNGALDLTGGVGANYFENDHFGQVLWVKTTSVN